MRISDWSSDVCSSDLPSSARSCTEARRRTRTMRTIFKGMLAVACMLAASFMGAGEARADKLSEILERGTVRVIVFADVPPFSSINANRELEGFDVDLAKMVAQSLGVKLELVQATAAKRIPYPITDKADKNIAAM